MTFTHDKTIKYVKKKAYQQMLYLLVLACSYVRCFIIPLSIDSENETSICYKISIDLHSAKYTKRCFVLT